MGIRVTVPDAVTTYRYLRLALVALVVFLAASIVGTRLRADGWQTSISAYFYTSSHGVFVASLCAVGICLIVYQGSTTTEDALLNFSGFLAFIVALVPTDREEPRGPGLPKDFDPKAFVDNNVVALLVATAAVIIAYVFIRKMRDVTPDEAVRDEAVSWHAPERGLLRLVVRLLKLVLRITAWLLSVLEALLPWALLAALIAGGVLFFTVSQFRDDAHGVAATAMFGGIVVVAVHYACYAAVRSDREEWARIAFVASYLVIALAMLLTVGVAVGFHLLKHGHGTIIVEAMLIAEFAAFWLVQSIDLWALSKYRVPSLSRVLEELSAES